MNISNESRADNIKKLISKNLDLLNKLEPHLGCALCHGPLINERCPKCQE